MNYKRKYNKVKGGNYHEYFNDHHSNRSVAFSIRRGRRLLLEKTTVGVVSHILTIYPNVAKVGELQSQGVEGTSRSKPTGTLGKAGYGVFRPSRS
jgi:hypothetical protein